MRVSFFFELLIASSIYWLRDSSAFGVASKIFAHRSGTLAVRMVAQNLPHTSSGLSGIGSSSSSSTSTVTTTSSGDITSSSNSLLRPGSCDSSSGSSESSGGVDIAPVIVGIAGGSASGKTTFALRVIEQLGAEHVAFIGHDSYYKELSHLSMEQRDAVNFDHPDSLDTALLVQHLQLLRANCAVQVPVYDFSTHSRTAATRTVLPQRVVIVDGILIFAEPALLQLMDMKIFVDTEDDLRLIRRIERDIQQRGRSVQQVVEQYRRSVRPMHQLFVEPSKRSADIIVPTGPGECRQVALDMCVSRLREIINFYQ